MDACLFQFSHQFVTIVCRDHHGTAGHDLVGIDPKVVADFHGLLTDRDFLQIHFQTDPGSACHLPERTKDTTLGDIMHRGYTMLHGDP